jgi:hypothetical protein
MTTMIVKIKFNEGMTMLFGDSYKTWKKQLTEYLDLFRFDSFLDVWHSKAEWIGSGGLKWCCEEDFPELLRERENRDIAKIHFHQSGDDIIDAVMDIISSRQRQTEEQQMRGMI